MGHVEKIFPSGQEKGVKPGLRRSGFWYPLYTVSYLPLASSVRDWAKGKVPSHRGAPQISPGRQGPTTRR